MDSNLNLIKSFDKIEKNYFIVPWCKEDHLYVCDDLNKRIQILSINFEYIDTIQLNYWPYSFKMFEGITKYSFMSADLEPLS